MAEISLERWHMWNAYWGKKLYHEDGFLVMTRGEMKPGSYEHESHGFLSERGHPLERLAPALLRERHPEWNADVYQDGYHNPRGGWVESGRVVSKLKAQALAAGVAIHEQVPLGSWIEEGDRILGMVDGKGRDWRAEVTVAALGAWTPELLPWLKPVMWATAQSVFHFQPENPGRFRAPHFPVWAADIGLTGWYGFPANADGIVKIANHGPGRRVSAGAPRTMPATEEPKFRQFLQEAFPTLADAPLAGSRVCLYCDTFDGNFWITPDSKHEGLIVAAGDSGHAFKFAPVLGGLIADAVEHRNNPWLGRFAEREPFSSGREGARAIEALIN
jgi:glycine/D-amino acid oxidase-like deaminating enzyme